jgi:DNA ligase 1
MNSTGKSTRRAFVGGCLATPIASWGTQRAPPPLMQANAYRVDTTIDLERYWVAEKLDGVRAYWTGSELLTRTGNLIAAPTWFIAPLPTCALDGELWGGRGTFERTSGVVRALEPRDAAWRAISYMIFDLPAESGPFDERCDRLAMLAATMRAPWVAPIQQARVVDANELYARLRDVEAHGGEGLMLHRGAARYVAGRSDDLLKMKSFDDAEAKIVGYLSGKGKYVGLVGALLVERSDGVQFRIGSGLSDKERRHPPAIGSWVTYAYNGFTNSGLPRFPRFVRVSE